MEEKLKKILEDKRLYIIGGSVMTVLMILYFLRRFFGITKGFRWFNPYRTYAVIILSVLAVLFLLYVYLMFVKKVPMERAYLVMILSFGIGYMSLILPYATPDEETHINTAYEVSNRMMWIKEDSDEGIYKRNCDNIGAAGFNPILSHKIFVSYMDKAFDPAGDTELSVQPVQTAPPEFLYIPCALGMTLARLLGLNYTWLLFFSQFFNLAFCVAMIYYALRKLPFGKTLLMGITLLPLMLQQFASCSRDGIIFGAAVIVVALSLRLRFTEEKLKKSEIVILVLCMIVLIFGKSGAYFPVCLFPGILQLRKEHFTKKRVLIGIFILLLLIAGVGIFLIKFSPPAAHIGWANAPGYSMKYLASHPLVTMKIYLDTILSNVRFYYQGMIGWLGWFQFYLGWKQVLGYTVILVLLTLNIGGECLEIQGKDRVILIVIPLLSFLLGLTGMLLFHTPAGYETISGYQGRYLMPVLLPGLLAFRNNKPITEINIERQLMALLYLVEMYTMMHMFTMLS